MIFGIVIAFLVALLVFSLWSSSKRHELLKTWATERGWSYAKSDSSLVHRWDTVPFRSGRGNGPKATNVMWGPTVLPNGQSREVLTFTFTYTVTSGSGDNQTSTTYNHHVLAIFLGVTTPDLTLTPETFSSKVSKFFGGQDIQFESESFNKAWRIESNNPRFAHDIVHPRMMEHLMQPQFKKLSVVFPGDCVLVFNDRSLNQDLVDTLIAIATSVIDRIPSHVWADLS